MRHVLFITEEGFSSPRWRQAFANASVVIASQHEPASANLVWVLTGLPGWEQLIREQTALGRTVLALTRRPQLEELRQALAAGARGYLEAMSSTAILAQAAATVEAGGMWLPAELVNRMVGLLSPLLAKNAASPQPAGCDLSRLTARERQVMDEVLGGASNKRIALTLNITERTVKAHLSSVFEKLGARDRMHLMLLAHGKEQG